MAGPYSQVSARQTPVLNTTLFQIIAPVPFAEIPPEVALVGSYFESGSLVSVSYVIVVSSGLTAGAVSFQTLQKDGTTWLTLTNPPSLKLFASQTIAGSFMIANCMGIRALGFAMAGGTGAQGYMIATVTG